MENINSKQIRAFREAQRWMKNYSITQRSTRGRQNTRFLGWLTFVLPSQLFVSLQFYLFGTVTSTNPGFWRDSALNEKLFDYATIDTCTIKSTLSRLTDIWFTLAVIRIVFFSFIYSERQRRQIRAFSEAQRWTKDYSIAQRSTRVRNKINAFPSNPFTLAVILIDVFYLFIRKSNIDSSTQLTLSLQKNEWHRPTIGWTIMRWLWTKIVWRLYSITQRPTRG